MRARPPSFEWRAAVSLWPPGLERCRSRSRRSGSRVDHVTSDRRGIREILDDVALGLTLVEKRQERARTFLSGFAAQAQPANGPSLPTAAVVDGGPSWWAGTAFSNPRRQAHCANRAGQAGYLLRRTPIP